jgi:hypothetical protein
MISARQAKNIIDYSLQSTAGFIEPVISFYVTPNNYSTIDVGITTINFTGTIIQNNATLISWQIKQGSTVLNSGTSNSINFTMPKPILTTTYSLVVSYTGGLTTQTLSAMVLVTEPALYGQLPLPSDNISIASDLLPFISGLNSSNQQFIGNLFNLTLTNTGRIVFVPPHSFGIVIDIVDENDQSVMNEFNFIDDISNSRYIYVSTNTLTSGIYKYKLQY